MRLSPSRSYPSGRGASIWLFVCVLAASLPLHAAIEGGPVLTNAVAAKKRLQTQYFEAQQSYEEKLKVGRQRYEQKAAARAKVIAAMDSQLRAREQAIIGNYKPTPRERLLSFHHVESSFAGLALVLGLTAFGIYLKRRQRAWYDRPPLWKRIQTTLSSWLHPTRRRYKVTALKPIVIWANIETPTKNRGPIHGKAQKSKAVWVQLKPGESRTELAQVVGIRADCVPNGRRICLEEADADIVPLEGWCDRDLPRTFFDSFQMESMN
jgi:hypothetical protein